MLAQVSSLLILVSFCKTLQGQTFDSIPALPCQQVEISEGKKPIISRFIEDCVNHREFINNKGVIRLTESTNSKGLLCWRLSITIDDGYKINPPKKFADFDGDIILLYEADSLGRRHQNPNLGEYNKCLEEVIGDRVYLRPTIKTRWTNRLKDAWGKKIAKRGRDLYVFDGGVEWFVVFNKNGTYKINY